MNFSMTEHKSEIKADKFRQTSDANRTFFEIRK